MRVFLTGATGFIGRQVLFALAARGHEVTCLARGPGVERIAAWQLPNVRAVAGEFTRPAEWLDAIAGQEVVINAVGIIRERGGTTFELVHRAAPIALFDAAARRGVAKIIQLSALGADAGAQSQYHLTKRAADDYLRALGVPYVVLRPSFVYGPYDQSMKLFASFAALPITPVPGDGQYRIQPVAVEDLVRAVILAVEQPTIRDAVVDVGGASALRFDDLFHELARWLGKPRGATIVHIPWPVMQAVAAVTDRLGGRGPITSDELAMLRRGNHAPIEPFAQLFGFRPAPFCVGLARNPADTALRWYARLFPLRLPLRASIAFIWFFTGLVSAFFFPEAESLERLATVGVTGALARVGLYSLCGLEMILGGLTAAGWRIRLVGTIELLLMLGFTLALSAATPALWLEPFGPLSKNVPLLAATLVMMAIED